MDGSVAAPRPILALVIRFFAAGSLATMAMLVKLAGSRGVALPELLFWRQAVTLVVLGSAIALTGRLATLRTERLGAHARRAFLGVTSMAFVYGAVLLLPLAEATVLGFTTPLFAVLIALIWFRERIGIYRWTAVGLGFLGVGIVMLPDLGGGVSVEGLAVGLIAGAFVALISFLIQDLNRSESPWSIVFWFVAFTTPALALFLPFVGAAHDPTTWGIVIAMGLAGAVAQLFLTWSLRFGSAATIIVIDYTSLVWAVFYGEAVFGRLPPATLWLGAPLIIGAGLVVAWREHRLGRRNRAG
ncbi:DMT family transporter [Erythrobacter sp. LQ02-29]|uniref:DMT family transporter n=1 Tax=Erythrobacter sp. LQ02-29 TaxID=2920384 RepID=UPI001F4D432E|nr:DMT family transporter [Erythrobacter sp. LQ02-29]MCP9222339.1 DMT family transporter [Erythrobacter sp. LQ02-29]